MNMKKDSRFTQKMVQTGLFIALALIIRSFSYMIYIGGAPGMRITFSGIFLKLVAILFGPLFGGISSGILDILGFITKPEGAYIPWLTATAILGGVIVGILWIIFRHINIKSLQWGFFLFFIVIGLVGVINHVNILFIKDSSYSNFLNSIGKNRDFATIGLEVIAILGLILLFIDYIIQKKNSNVHIHENFLKILIVTGISGLIVTTLNTYVLQIFIPALAKKGFLIFWIPRVIQEILMATIQAYIIAFLYSIYKKLYANKY